MTITALLNSVSFCFPDTLGECADYRHHIRLNYLWSLSVWRFGELCVHSSLFNNNFSAIMLEMDGVKLYLEPSRFSPQNNSLACVPGKWHV